MSHRVQLRRPISTGRNDHLAVKHLILDTMTDDLTRTILQRAYGIDGTRLDAEARCLGAADWEALTRGLEFGDWDSGGGCTTMAAALPDDHVLQITDGEANMPTSADRFWLGIVDADGEETLTVSS